MKSGLWSAFMCVSFESWKAHLCSGSFSSLTISHLQDVLDHMSTSPGLSPQAECERRPKGFAGSRTSGVRMLALIRVFTPLPTTSTRPVWTRWPFFVSITVQRLFYEKENWVSLSLYRTHEASLAGWSHHGHSSARDFRAGADAWRLHVTFNKSPNLSLEPCSSPFSLQRDNV